MKRYALVLLICLFAFGCDAKKLEPVEVEGPVAFGPYQFTPPLGYWHLPREFPEEVKATDKGFVVSFFETRDSIPTLAASNPPFFINFTVMKRSVDDINDFYADASTKHMKYKPLPQEAAFLDEVEGWDCKKLHKDLYAIECFRLSEHRVNFSVIGYEREDVLTRLDLLKGMMESFRYLGEKEDGGSPDTENGTEEAGEKAPAETPEGAPEEG